MMDIAYSTDDDEPVDMDALVVAIDKWTESSVIGAIWGPRLRQQVTAPSIADATR